MTDWIPPFAGMTGDSKRDRSPNDTATSTGDPAPGFPARGILLEKIVTFLPTGGKIDKNSIDKVARLYDSL